MEESLHDTPVLRKFAGMDNRTSRLPDKATVLRFRHLLEKHKLGPQILVTVCWARRDKCVRGPRKAL